MGCTQSSERVIPQNYPRIERLYVNDDYGIKKPLPLVSITAEPTPSFVKGALKRTYQNPNERVHTYPFSRPKLPSHNKTVNFDEQVLVKARSPTPDKVWYEKASTTMPMRRHPCNDDDDYDYDYEVPTSDDEQENNQQSDDDLQLPAPRPPTPLRYHNQSNPFPYQTDTTGVISSTNPAIDSQPYHNRSTYATGNQFPSPINQIKVRRQLPTSVLPEHLPPSLYQSSPQYSTIPTYQLPTHPPIISTDRIPLQTPFVSPYQSSMQPVASSQIYPVNQTLPNTNVTNNQSLPQTTYHPINHPFPDNLT